MKFPSTLRAEFVLMALGRYAYGQHVQDPQAFLTRLRKVLTKRLRGDHLTEDTADVG